MSDRLLVEGLECYCVVGTRPLKRESAQPLVVSLELHLDLSIAARSESLSDTCHYGKLADEIDALLRFRRYRLLETAAEEVAAMTLCTRPAVQDVVVAIRKPHGLRRFSAAAGVMLRRRRADYRSARPEERTEVLRTKGAVLELLGARGDQLVCPAPGRDERALQWVVGAGRTVNEVPHEVADERAYRLRVEGGVLFRCRTALSA